MSNSSVITKEEGGLKRGCNNDVCRCRFAIMNPQLTMTLPAYQTASGCVDIMMHTMERYFDNNPGLALTDSIAEGLIKTVMKNAVILKDNPQDYEARAEVMWASSLSHNGLTGCGGKGGDWVCHKMEHELGGMFDVTHGAGLAAVWGSWARYVYKDCMDRFTKFAVNVMGIEAGGDADAVILAGIQAMEDFFRSIDMPVTIRELGVDPTEEQVKEMAAKCYVANGGPKGTAKLLVEEDLYQIYKAAL